MLDNLARQHQRHPTGGVGKGYGLTVFPDPGEPGLSIIAGSLTAPFLEQTTDGPAASARFRQSYYTAADQAGNPYVAGVCLATYAQACTRSRQGGATTGRRAYLENCDEHHFSTAISA